MMSLLGGCGAQTESAPVAPVQPAAPSISSFGASLSTITVGFSSALTAVFSNGAGVITPGNIAVTSGVAVSVSPAATTIYTLTVTPTSGSAITQPLTVTVTPAVGASLIANGTYSIVSKKSGLDVEVQNNSTAGGAAIDQSTSTGLIKFGSLPTWEATMSNC
jgi:hypothetical protein